MRRWIVVLLSTVTIVASATSVAAQEDENEGEVVIEGTPVDTVPPTTVPPPPTTEPPASTLPAGCSEPAPPAGVFTGVLTAADFRTARFDVDEIVEGSIESYVIERRIDVDFETDVRYLDIGKRYRVAVEINGETARLQSKAKPDALLIGGNQVIGAQGSQTDCPEFEDPIVSRMADGSSIDTGVLSPMLAEKRKIARSLLQPAGVALLVLFGLVLVRRTVLAAFRLLARWIRGKATEPARPEPAPTREPVSP